MCQLHGDPQGSFGQQLKPHFIQLLNALIV